MQKAAVLWTGGKDSVLALFESLRHFSIDRLVTFVPKPRHRFYAHPLELMNAQAESIGLPHQCLTVKEPFKDSYQKALSGLAQGGIDTVITGDIAPVDGQPNWINECAQGIIEVHNPLWEADRKDLLDELISNRFEVICSFAKKNGFPSTIAGRYLNSQLISELFCIDQSSGPDICGENGEYHTSVLSVPFFQKRLEFTGLQVKNRRFFISLFQQDIK